MKKVLFILFGLILLAACQEKVEYPIEPKIAYEGMAYVIDADSTLTGEVVLSISYTDGDGDLGLDDADTLYPFGPNDPHYYNLIIDYMKWDGSAFVETPLLSWNQQAQSYDTVSFNARFKRLVFYDEVKPISGTIDYKMMVFNPLSPNDTIKFKVHLIDRALHESNTIETDAIVIATANDERSEACGGKQSNLNSPSLRTKCGNPVRLDCFGQWPRNDVPDAIIITN